MARALATPLAMGICPAAVWGAARPALALFVPEKTEVKIASDDTKVKRGFLFNFFSQLSSPSSSSSSSFFFFFFFFLFLLLLLLLLLRSSRTLTLTLTLSFSFLFFFSSITGRLPRPLRPLLGLQRRHRGIDRRRAARRPRPAPHPQGGPVDFPAVDLRPGARGRRRLQGGVAGCRGGGGERREWERKWWKWRWSFFSFSQQQQQLCRSGNDSFPAPRCSGSRRFGGGGSSGSSSGSNNNNNRSRRFPLLLLGPRLPGGGGGLGRGPRLRRHAARPREGRRRQVQRHAA